MIQAFYRLAEALARARGLDPDRPPHLAESHGDGVMATALVNGRVLLDEGFVTGQAVLIEGDRIAAVVREPEARGTARVDLGGGLLLPGFIDVQVNGGGGALFNDSRDVDTIRRIGAAHRQFGTTGFLPTLISDDLAVVDEAMRAAGAAMEAGVPGVLGIHVEGPFLNETRKGVHDAGWFRELDESGVRLLTSCVVVARS